MSLLSRVVEKAKQNPSAIGRSPSFVQQMQQVQQLRAMVEEAKSAIAELRKLNADPEDLLLVERAVQVIEKINKDPEPSESQTQINILSAVNDVVVREWLRHQFALPEPFVPHLRDIRSLVRSVKNALVFTHELTQLTAKQKPDSIREGRLSRIGFFDFDVFNVCKWTNNMPLPVVAECIFKANLSRHFAISEQKLMNFLQEVTDMSASHPYHNSIRAADLLQTAHATILSLEDRLFIGSFSDCEICALLIACCVHHVAHPALNNSFLVNSSDPMALLYNDKVINENTSCAACFRIFQKAETNFLCDIPTTERLRIRQLVISMIRSTDTSKHLKLVTQWSAINSGLDLSVVKNRETFLKIFFKFVVSSNLAKRRHLACAWSSLCLQEMYYQGDKEKLMEWPGKPLGQAGQFLDRNRRFEALQFPLLTISHLVEPVLTVLIDIVEFLPSLPCGEENVHSSVRTPLPPNHQLLALRNNVRANTQLFEYQQRRWSADIIKKCYRRYKLQARQT